MPIIIVRAFKRPQNKKKKLAELITRDVCKTFEVSKEHVRIYFEDRKRSDVFIGGTSLLKKK
ncbi:MAG: tautomerase family protein [Candidatus Bathyarchaeota archaeon]|nr:MAG: tautomerase family protein [Candidatus Bathyarchaeota archaeon]